MQSGGRSSTDGHERFAFRRGLVVVQVALSLVLVVGALLFGRSLSNLAGVDPGFDPANVLHVNVDLRRSTVDPDARRQSYLAIMERVRAVPGVTSAAEAFIVPLSGSGWNQNIVIDGVEQEGNVNINRVDHAFFETLRTPVLTGRTFTPDDRLGGVETAVVNETFVRKYFSGADPLGRTFSFVGGTDAPKTQYQIVGTVRDTKYNDLREELTPIAYLAAAQEAEPGPYFDLILRTGLPAASLTPTLTRTIRDVAPGSTVAYDTLSTYLRDSLVTERLMASLSGFLGPARDADRDDRTLRGDVVHGEPAARRDRDPHGARRRPRTGGADGAPRVGHPARDRRRRRGRPEHRRLARGREPALRSRAVGPGLARAGGRHRSAS